MHFGQYIKNKRQDLGWTQPDAASKIGIEQSYLSKLETGKSVPSDDIFNKMKTVYKIDLDDMAESVIESDLIKLNEVKSIKATVHALEKKHVTATRSWLVTGLLMLILGGSFLGATQVPNKMTSAYNYRSQGVLQAGEDLTTFSVENLYPKYGSKLSTEARQQLLKRMDQKNKSFADNRGNSFLENSGDELRYYEFIDRNLKQTPGFPNWFRIPAFAFLIGGFACFLIAFMWRRPIRQF